MMYIITWKPIYAFFLFKTIRHRILVVTNEICLLSPIHQNFTFLRAEILLNFNSDQPDTKANMSRLVRFSSFRALVYKEQNIVSYVFASISVKNT